MPVPSPVLAEAFSEGAFRLMVWLILKSAGSSGTFTTSVSACDGSSVKEGGSGDWIVERGSPAWSDSFIEFMSSSNCCGKSASRGLSGPEPLLTTTKIASSSKATPCSVMLVPYGVIHCIHSGVFRSMRAIARR